MPHQRFAELGLGLEPLPAGRVRPHPPIYTEQPAGMPVDGAYGPADAAPRRIARWRWSGRPEAFDLLDLDQDEAVVPRSARRAPPPAHPSTAANRGARGPRG